VRASVGFLDRQRIVAPHVGAAMIPPAVGPYPPGDSARRTRGVCFKISLEAYSLAEGKELHRAHP